MASSTMSTKAKRQAIERRAIRMKSRIRGTAARPRLRVTRSLKNITAQLIDDDAGTTLLTLSTVGKAFEQYGGNIAAAAKLGEMVAAKALEKNVKAVVFDRGGRMYHGRIKALADAARKGGLQF